jgi:hypothetical protein
VGLLRFAECRYVNHVNDKKLGHPSSCSVTFTSYRAARSSPSSPCVDRSAA